MRDFTLNNIIVLIPVAIFVVRFILQATGKRKEPPSERPKPLPPLIPVHFEDDIKPPKISVTKTKQIVHQPHKSPKPLLFLSEEKKVSSDTFGQAIPKRPMEEKNKASQVAASKKDAFFLKLNKLSPIKQAVVMAELLGPPKSLQ